MDSHFYLAGLFQWVTTGQSYSLADAIKMFGKDPFSIWYIPHPPETGYEIRMYVPQIEGAKFIEWVNLPPE
jgi:hypothetical protein